MWLTTARAQRAGSQQGWGHLPSHQHQVPQVRGLQAAPPHPRQLEAPGWRPSTFCPGHAHRAQWEKHGHSPPPARPGPSKQLGWEHVSGLRLCPAMLHPPLRPGKAGAGATLGSPSPASCQCCCTSPLTPRGHVGAGGAECA